MSSLNQENQDALDGLKPDFIREASANASIQWNPLKELPPLIPETPSLPEDKVPSLLRPWLTDVQERMQIPLEMLVAPAIVAISSVIGRRCAIRPLRRDPWKVVPNLWGAVVAPPGFFKSPALKEVMSPLLRLENEKIEDFKILQAQKAADEFSIEMKIKAIKGEIEHHHKSKGKTKKTPESPESKKKLPPSLEELKINLTNAQKELENTKLFCPRLTTNDATIEKLGELLKENPNGLLVYRDELYGYLIGLEKQGREQDRAFYLETWNGDGEFKGDRIVRGSSHISGLCLSILGGIQPDRLASYFSNVICGNTGDDGFFSRFQMTVFPTLPKTWAVNDRFADIDAKDNVFAALKRLYELNFREEFKDETTTNEVPAINFSPEAQELFYEFLTKLENRVRSGNIESAAWIAHLAKYRKLMPSLSLIFHLMDYIQGTTKSPMVSLEAAILAAEWCDFLEAHAEKVYAGMIQPSIQAAHALAKRILTQQVADQMPVRDIYRKNWSLLEGQKKTESAIGVLVECNWVKIEEQPTGGAPRELLRLNPSLSEKLRS